MSTIEKVCFVISLVLVAAVCIFGSQYLYGDSNPGCIATVILVILIWKAWEYVSVNGSQGIVIILFAATLSGLSAFLGYEIYQTRLSAEVGFAIGIVSSLIILWVEKIPGGFCPIDQGG